MNLPNFKEGQWLIRRWAKDNGGDIVRFKKPLDEGNFFFSKFYRIKGNRIDNYSTSGTGKDNKVTYHDYRMSLQFRPATKSEIQRFSEKIITSNVF